MKTLMRSLAGLTALAVLAAGLAAQDVSLGGKKAKTPSGWKEEAPANQMRYAQFKLPKVAGDDADAELVVFKGLGGSADANIDRCIHGVCNRAKGDILGRSSGKQREENERRHERIPSVVQEWIVVHTGY